MPWAGGRSWASWRTLWDTKNLAGRSENRKGEKKIKIGWTPAVKRPSLHAFFGVCLARFRGPYKKPLKTISGFLSCRLSSGIVAFVKALSWLLSQLVMVIFSPHRQLGLSCLWVIPSSCCFGGCEGRSGGCSYPQGPFHFRWWHLPVKFFEWVPSFASSLPAPCPQGLWPSYFETVCLQGLPSFWWL